MLIGANVRICAEANRDLKIEDVRKSTCNVAMLTSWFLKNKVYNPIVFNRLVEYSSIFYSNLKIKPYYLNHRLLLYDEDFRLVDRLKGKIMNVTSDDIFVFATNDPGFIDIYEYRIFKTLTRKLKKEIIIRKKFLWKDGTVRFIACSLK